MLNYENIRLTRDYNNNDNRVTICYSANYEKALKNGINNIKDIKIVEKCYGLQNFSERDLKIFENTFSIMQILLIQNYLKLPLKIILQFLVLL